MRKEDFKEEILCCNNLPGRTAGSEILRFLNEYFSDKDTGWKRCVGVCIDGAASMTSYRLGAVPKIKRRSPQRNVFTFCINHREHLAAKKLPTDFKNVVKTVYEVKSRLLNPRLLKTLDESVKARSDDFALFNRLKLFIR